MYWRWTLVCLVAVCALVSVRPLAAAETQARDVPSSRRPLDEGIPYRPKRGDEGPHLVTRRVAWYGYQTLAVDLAATALVYTGLRYDKGALVWTGLGTYLLGAPLVHLAHGGPANRSLGFRLVPLAITAAGAVTCYAGLAWAAFMTLAQDDYDYEEDEYGETGDDENGNDLAIVLPVVIGCTPLVVGVLAFPVMMIADAAGLAYKPVAPKSTAQSVFLPSYAPTPRTGMLSWSGRF